jgi:Ser-tRNA(Ala) deacylase AlaX
MTKKLFWHDPYLRQIDTHIRAVNGQDVTVAETIFYSFAGGQERDTGTIGTYPVLDAHKDELEIIYTLPLGHNLQVGDAVTMTIDWERRYRLMRLHFAAEIILELVYQNLTGIEKIGAHIAADKSRIDFIWHENIAQHFPLLTAKANELITAQHPIVSAFSDEPTERRYWEIAGFARVDCGGTHIKHTGEVGTIELKRRNIGKGKERIEISLVED